MATTPHSLVGQRIFGGYTISRKVGEGGMGAVYIAENVELNKKLAVKLLLPEWAHNEQIVARFLAEARAASAINHPNIIEIIDAAQLADGSYYILMEFLEGNSLRAFAQSWGALAVDMALAIIAQVCSALDATHMRGIVHRDLKPANLMVSPTPTNQLFTKVLDFGIAKLNDARLAGNVKTGTNAIAGTPAYMSPEQARATRDVDHRSDIYSLGVIIYELLAGMRPYSADSIGELAYQQATAQPPPLAQHRPDLPPAWCEVVHACLAIDPDQRPQTMRDLAHALVDATPNGKHIATSVAPLLFTNAPKDAATFKYQGDYGIGVAPSAPQQHHAAANDLGSAATMAARNGPNPPTPVNQSAPRVTKSADGQASLPVANTLTAAPEPGKPNTTLSSMASEVNAPAVQTATPATTRPPWIIPVALVAAVGLGVGTFALVSGGKGKDKAADQTVASEDDAAPAKLPTDAATKTASGPADAQVVATKPVATKPVATKPVKLDDAYFVSRRDEMTPELKRCAARYRSAGTFKFKMVLGTKQRLTTARMTSGPSRRAGRCMTKLWLAASFPSISKAQRFTITWTATRRALASSPSRKPPEKPTDTAKKPTVTKPVKTEPKKPPKKPDDKPFDPDDPAGG